MASCVDDVAAVADALGYDRFYSVGGSGGGPHSIACAVLLPDRVIAEYLELQAQQMLGASGDEIIAALGDLVSDADRCGAMTGALGEFITREAEHSLSSRVWGWFDDDRAILGDWGFDYRAADAPLHHWHGAQDRFVPIAHGEWLARQVRAETHLRPNDGHLSLSLGSYGEILDTLLQH